MKPKNDMKNSYPGSEKVYVPGKLYDIQVGMRKVNLTDTVKIVDGKRITRHNDPVNRNRFGKRVATLAGIMDYRT